MDFQKTQFSGLLNSIVHEKTKYEGLLWKLRTILAIDNGSKLILNHLGKLINTSIPSEIYKHVNYKHPFLKILIEFINKLPEAPINSHYFIDIAQKLVTQILYLLENNVKPKLISNVLYDIVADIIVKLNNDNIESKVQNISLDNNNKIVITNEIKTFIFNNLKNDHVTELLCQSIESVNSFDYEQIRICKIANGSLEDSYKLEGMVISREPAGVVKHLQNTSAAIFNCGFELAKPELKSTVLFTNHNQLLNFSKDETLYIKEFVEKLNFNIAIVSGNVDDQFLYFADERNILVFRVFNNYDLKRLATSIGASIYNKLGPVTNKGLIKEINVFEDNGTKYTKIIGENRVCTIVLKYSVSEILYEYERLIELTLHNLKRSRTYNFAPCNFHNVLKEKIGTNDCIRTAIGKAVGETKNWVVFEEDQIQTLKSVFLFLATLLEVDDYLVAKKDVLDVKPRKSDGHWDEDH